MKRLGVSMVALLMAIIAFAQERNFYAEAEQAFKRCEYARAANLYGIAQAMTDRNTSAKQELCEECADAQEKAREQKSLGNTSEAEMWYQRILEANPNDTEAKNYIFQRAEARNILAEADSAFVSGNYDAAREIYSDIYVKDGDKSSKELLDKCKKCITLISDATTAERQGQFETAIEKYQAVMGLNPTDKNIPTLIAECKQRLYAPKLQSAKQCYRKGKYSEAREYLNEYASLSGATDADLFTAITEGILWSNEAKSAFEKKDYDLARSYYDKILSTNPTDDVSLQAVAEINRIIQKEKTVFVKDPTKISLRPIKNRFQFFMYSGFGRPVELGCGIGFNTSYFNFGIDVGGVVYGDSLIEDTYPNDQYINDSNLGKFVKIDDNTYTQGSLQLVATPGVNLKYISVGIGFGSMMTKECSINHTYSSRNYVDVTNKSRFLIRPTINVLIPFVPDYSGGLIVMVGYNIVSGVSGLNQFILGLGVFL